MIEPHGPVFTQELGDIWDQPALESNAELIQVILAQSYKTDQGGHADILITEVHHIVYNSVVVKHKSYILSIIFSGVVGHHIFPILFCVDQLFGTKDIVLADIVVDQLVRKSRTNTHWHTEFGQGVFIQVHFVINEIAQIESLQ